MPQLCEHGMLEQCLSIHARRNAEQCPTYNHIRTHVDFLLLEHSCHVSDARRGAEQFIPSEGEKRSSDFHPSRYDAARIAS